MSITPEELLWIKRRIEVAKSISLISQQQQQQQQRPPTHDASVGYGAIGSPPIAALSVPPVNIHNTSPMAPLVVSAAPMLMAYNHPYQPHHHPSTALPQQHIYYPQSRASAIILPNGTLPILNTSVPPHSEFNYQQSSGGGYNNLLAPPPATAAAQAQLTGTSYSPEDELSRKITQRIQEKLKRLNPGSLSEKQPSPLDFTSEHTFQLDAQDHSGTNETGVVHAAAGPESVTESVAPIDATAHFEMNTADFEKKSSFAVGLIRKRLDEIIARGRAGLPEQSDVALDTIPTFLANFDNTRCVRLLDTKRPAKRKRRDRPNIEKISEELDYFAEKCLDDENIRCALNEDKANQQMKREKMKEVYKKCMKDIQCRFEMYTELEHLAEKIAVIRMARGKKRNSSTSDLQIEGDCDVIRLHLKNYRMLEDEMDRILGIGQEEK